MKRPPIDLRDERRIYPREATNQLISYARYRDYQTYQDLGMGATLDISLGGMRIQTPVALKFGWIPEFRVALGNEIIRVRGRIVHIDALRDCPVCGIEFTYFQEGHREVLARFLRSRQRRALAA